MIKEGVEYGYLTTGQAFIFLRIREDDPTTLYHHLAEPIRDAEAQDGAPFPFSSTAISSVLTPCLLASGSNKRDQEWRSRAIFALHTWAVDVEYILAKIAAEEKSRTPSGSSYVPSSPPSSPIKQPGKYVPPAWSTADGERRMGFVCFFEVSVPSSAGTSSSPITIGLLSKMRAH